ncbi:hypothetical protein TVNIR_2005 [Thioalkalivibrio nitratireducens DSM 14787]|uniref:Heme-binding protein n=1 Tax=Thioalkalivibrio nitratireducens (strain DSM 14787 / UNIQEM 213 / ALEN2) TaxID=1255043 RepID=L0DZ63_THIND|nr:heme-binding protein [Thioalkalivibrio nitratireducens]AGA33666.1 hypothetical protein TVNIR_2005 [Thioalkalivibrio nitratireducens DSM 14787]
MFRLASKALTRGLPALALLVVTPALLASDFLTQRVMSMEMARDIAQATVDACREMGYQTSAVVVDRGGHPQAILRDSLAAPFTIQIAHDKARAVILSNVASSAFRTNRNDIRMEMNHVDGILVLDGGLPVEVAGSMVGAVGVSGAPGGHLDEQCAQAALDALADRIDFAM